MATPPTLHMSTHARTSQSAASTIERSWKRCAGLDPAALRDPNPMGRADLQARREAHRLLLAHSEAGITALGSLAGSARSLVLLADASGVILHESGAKEFLNKARRVALQPGVSWAESSRGTNAIGTALFDGKAVRVHGAEHFLSCNRILSCHAAPVFSGEGDILGVLDLSGPADEMQGYALGLVQMYAKQIGDGILCDSPLRRLMFRSDGTQADAARTGILLIDDMQCIAGANQAALELLEGDWRLIGTPVEQWLDDALQLDERPGRLKRHDGNVFTGALHAPRRPTRVAADPSKAPLTPIPGARVQPQIDAAMQVLLEPAVRAIDAGLALLLQGETGTGKEVLARRLHAQSRWHAGAFIAINCGALPEGLVESELFGYAAGAFTGARREGARGLLQQAHKGVVFLDEIGDMPLTLQTRLLRVLQEREVQPLGSEKRIALEFGLISASHRDLKAMVAQGEFRSDLYYRLQDMHIPLPALRMREDLPELLQTSFAEHGGGRLSEDALVGLSRYPWPGNYREMHSILRRLACLHPDRSRIEAWMLPAEIVHVVEHEHDPASRLMRTPTAPSIGAPVDGSIPAPVGVPLGTPIGVPVSTPPETGLRELEQLAIRHAMSVHQGNISLAAQQLGIHRSTLYRRLKRQGRH